jgi:ankyrin repeat protein
MTSSTRSLKTTFLFALPFLIGSIVWCVLRPIALRHQFQSALVRKDLATINLLVAQGANPNANLEANDFWPASPIEIAIKQGDNAGLAFLLGRGARATAWGLGSELRESPLMLAVRRRNVEAVKMLLTHGANEQCLHNSYNRHDFTLEGSPEFFFTPPQNVGESRRQKLIVNLIKSAAKKSSQ